MDSVQESGIENLATIDSIYLDHAPATVVGRTGPGLVYFIAKRTIDIVLSIAALIVLAPIFALIALAIKLDSPGPALFVQMRTGSRRRTDDRGTAWETTEFRFYKFRSMVSDADQSIHIDHIRAYVSGNLSGLAGDRAAFKLSKDKRITRLGAVLRATSLDELPQLMNVLRGDMSLVGPRPVPVYESNLYSHQQKERLNALPGMTGLWQVLGRGRVTFDEMCRMDIEYVRNCSLKLDMLILLKTLPAVIQAAGAR